MRIEYCYESGVNEDGTFDDGRTGSMNVKPGMNLAGGHQYDTPSNRRAGLWMNVSTGRLPDGTHHVIVIYFDDEDEMRKFEQCPKAVGYVANEDWRAD